MPDELRPPRDYLTRPDLPFPLPGFPVWWPPGFIPAPGIVVPVVQPTPTLPPPTTTPVQPPAPLPPPAVPPLGPPSGGLSPESIRQQAERAMRDSDVRRSAPPRIKIPGGTRGGTIFEGEILRRAGGGAARAIGRAVLGPIGAVIGGVIMPGRLGSGEISTEDMIEDVLAQSKEETQRVSDILNDIGRDIARGGGIIAAGGVIGGGIVIDQLRRLPPVIDVGDEPVIVKDVPKPDIPAPVFRQPGLPEVRNVIPSSLPLPRPAPPSRMPSRSSQTLPRAKPVGSQARFPSPTAPPVSQVWGLVAGAALSALRGTTRRSALTLPRSLTSTLTSSPTSTLTSSPTSTLTRPTLPPTSTVPLTGFQPLVLSSASAPPRLRTRTRQDECNCEPKRKRRPRKCRQSAPLTWAGGPRKGQSAGSKCYSFEE